MIQIPTPRSTTLSIVAEIAAKHELTLDEVMSKRRFKDVCQARFEAMWTLRDRLGFYDNKTARLFGVDHSTVANGLRRHEEFLAAREAEALEAA